MKFHRLAGVTAAFAIAACSAPEEAPPAAPAPAAAPAVVAAPPVPTIDVSGKWRVAQIWAADPDPGTPVIQVSIADNQISGQSQCKHWRWTYMLAGETFKATRAPNADASCERNDTPWEKYFAEAIDRATTLAPEPDGGVLITGPGGQVLIRPS